MSQCKLRNLHNLKNLKNQRNLCNQRSLHNLKKLNRKRRYHNQKNQDNLTMLYKLMNQHHLLTLYHLWSLYSPMNLQLNLQMTERILMVMQRGLYVPIVNTASFANCALNVIASAKHQMHNHTVRIASTANIVCCVLLCVNTLVNQEVPWI